MPISGSESDYLFKVVMIGDPSVGKSKLTLRFTDGTFDGNYSTTIGVDFKFRTIHLDGKIVKLQIWDTAGEERFRAMSRSFYRGAHAVVLVFDLTRLETFHSVDKWLQEVSRYNEGRDIPRLLVGNKCDCADRVVAYDTAKEYADRVGLPLIETSAKDATNVDQAFFSLAAEMKRAEADSRQALEGEERLAFRLERCSGQTLSSRPVSSLQSSTCC